MNIIKNHSVKRNQIFYLLLAAITFFSASDLLAHGGHKHDANVTLPVGINDFPSYHPLAVHFPIVLLIVAAIIQLIAMFSEYKVLHYLVAGITVFGFIGAYVASSILHPHTVPLSPVATVLLESHERFASYTIWLSGIASALKLFTLFKKKRIIEISTALVLLITAITVCVAGHHGAGLVHKFGIGPKGNYLEQNHNH
ncbi:MAG: DUF2231 domain-containing protein [Bacteroidota bacterium]